jgi:hypothetical protein
MSKGLKLLLLAFFICYWTDPAAADYLIVLKNGSRITVQNYREEGRMIKFHRPGGEIGISKDQIRAIQRVGEAEPTGLTSPEPKSAKPSASTGAPQSAERRHPPDEERAKEEKEYREKLGEIDAQLKAAWDRYLLQTRGTTTRQPVLLTTEEEIKKLNEDALSRLRDAEHSPTNPGVVDLTVQSPFSTVGTTTEVLRPPTPTSPAFGAPPPYTEKEKELSDLRNQILELGKARDNLIDEMKQKDFWTGTLSLE